VLGQYVRSRLLLARQSLAESDFSGAVAHLEAALEPPPNLGEARHLLANQSDIHFWLGEAHAANGHKQAARTAWKRAAEFRGDFQQMSVCPFSVMTYFSAMALRRLGKAAASDRLFRDLLAYTEGLEKATAKIDYFATSLPTMLLFDDDIQARQITTERFLKAQALLGLGKLREARALLEDVLARDPNHALAADFFSLTESAR
jgi:tetratricopeptide (TPR) repeat protein